MTMLVLSGHQVRELLPYPECAAVMREALAGLARGEIEQPPRTIVRPRQAAGVMALMPAHSARHRVYGLKAICITLGNPGVGKDAHQGGVLLSAADTGEPLALLNASAVTEIRTAATSAVATGLLARPGAAELAIVGSGVQARAHARAIAATRPLRGIRIAGRDLARTRELAVTLAAELSLPVTAHDGVAGALAGADIVITATTSRHPVLRRDWLSPGCHVNAVGACVPGDREIDTATMAGAAIFADSRESVRNEAGDYLLAEKEGMVNQVRAELGELLTGSAPGRLSGDEITVFESLGVAAEDLAAACHVYQKARSLGVGTRADF